MLVITAFAITALIVIVVVGFIDVGCDAGGHLALLAEIFRNLMDMSLNHVCSFTRW